MAIINKLWLDRVFKTLHSEGLEFRFPKYDCDTKHPTDVNPWYQFEFAKSWFELNYELRVYLGHSLFEVDLEKMEHTWHERADRFAKDQNWTPAAYYVSTYWTSENDAIGFIRVETKDQLLLAKLALVG